MESARRLFATAGFEQTSVRQVAEDAGVDPSLVIHYFDSKVGLLQAAMEWPFDIEQVAGRIFAEGMEAAGERLVRTVCGFWEDDTTRHPLTVILRNAIHDEEATRLAREFVEGVLVGRLVARSNDADAALRGTLVHTAIMGLVLARYVARLEPLASVPTETVVGLVGPTVQRYLTGDLGLHSKRSPGASDPAGQG